jgi:hypothetical protein
MTVLRDQRGNFEGHQPRDCGEHRTVGDYRAWCFDCSQWCYPRPDGACNGCRVPMLEAEIKALKQT